MIYRQACMLTMSFQVEQLKPMQFNTAMMPEPFYPRQASTSDPGCPTKLRAMAEQDNTIDTSTPSNILGIHWNAMTDQLSLISKMTEPMSNQTRNHLRFLTPWDLLHRLQYASNS